MGQNLPLITVCCVCNKYRNDEGVWHPDYQPLGKKGEDFEVSHGYCPPCFQKEIAQISKYKLSQLKTNQNNSLNNFEETRWLKII